MGLSFSQSGRPGCGPRQDRRAYRCTWKFRIRIHRSGHCHTAAAAGQPKAAHVSPDRRSHALINRLGFNNEGADQFVDHVRRQRSFRDHGGIVGLNIGKNADTPIERALEDYRMCLRRVYDDADYVAVNISSPNTKELRSLQSVRQLAALLTGLSEERKSLQDRHEKRVPIAVKIAPDVADASVPGIADQLVEHGMDAVIATNTTTARDKVLGQEHADESGGLSGRPLTERATQVVHLLAQHLQGALPIIGVGGIMSGPDAVEKIRTGASLVQIYTGFIYSGPQLVADCVEAIRDDGCAVSSPPGPTAHARSAGRGFGRCAAARCTSARHAHR